MQIVRRILKPLFWVAFAFAYIAAIVPPEDAIDFGSDKLSHMIAFLTLATLAGLAYPRLPLWRIGLLLALFGIAIELTQMIPALHRSTEMMDWYADIAAVVIGLLLAAFLRRPFARQLASE